MSRMSLNPFKSIANWFGDINPYHPERLAKGGLKPIEVIERGEVDRIWQMIYYLRSGVPS